MRLGPLRQESSLLLVLKDGVKGGLVYGYLVSPQQVDQIDISHYHVAGCEGKGLGVGEVVAATIESGSTLRNQNQGGGL